LRYVFGSETASAGSSPIELKSTTSTCRAILQNRLLHERERHWSVALLDAHTDSSLRRQSRVVGS
jgi:hypothetical protein